MDTLDIDAELPYEIRGNKVSATVDRVSHLNKSELRVERFTNRLQKRVSGINLNLNNMGL